MSTEASRPGAGDFDFFIGRWRVHHRRLNERLADCRDWTEFGGSCESRKILGGQGNMDDNVLELPGDNYRAVTIRTFDPRSSQWTIWWIDARNPSSLDPPVVGRFENGVGTFFSDDTFKGRPILVRFEWSTPAKDRPRWEQAFSADAGKNWETNWIMEFTRA
ncbi:MAG: DUF1579 domain-containing protein [Steroidobacteraceae bacterium]